MNQSLQTSAKQQDQSSNSSNTVTASPDWPQDIASVLKNVARLLDEGSNDAALDLVHRTKSKSPWLSNAAGVCHMRLGNYQLAVDTFRRMLLSGGVVLKQDTPDIFKVNFATALLLNKNYSGYSSVTCEIKNQALPELLELRRSFASWSASLPIWQRFIWSLGIDPKKPFVLDYLPGSIG